MIQTSLQKAFQENIKDILSPELSAYTAVVCQDSLDIEFEIKNALAKQQNLLLISVPRLDYIGRFENTRNHWQCTEIKLDCIEQPTINRAQSTFMTAQDIANKAADILCAPKSETYPSFNLTDIKTDTSTALQTATLTLKSSGSITTDEIDYDDSIDQARYAIEAENPIRLIQDWIAEIIDKTNLEIPVLPENCKDVKYEIQQNLFKTGCVALIKTPIATQLGHDSQKTAWQYTIDLEVYENPPIHRAEYDFTGEDLAYHISEILTNPNSPVHWYFQNRYITQKTENKLVKTTYRFETAAIIFNEDVDVNLLEKENQFNNFLLIEQNNGQYKFINLGDI